MEIKRVTVLGAGLMGHGIAQVAAQVGKFEVYLTDIDQKFLDNALGMIKDSLKRFVSKGAISEEHMSETLRRLHLTLDLKEAVEATDFIIEAIPENVELKKQVFAEVDRFAPEHAIITSNTSSISITELASATKRPEKFAGMHFFNPPQLMRLVEIIMGLRTSEETVNVIKEVASRMGKEAVIVRKDSPGFIVNRILVPALNEAVKLLMEGIASKEDIDKAVTLGLNWPMGPLKLLDYIGLDTAVSVGEVIFRETGDPEYKPPVLLRQMVRGGLLGRKAGKGFYEWVL